MDSGLEERLESHRVREVALSTVLLADPDLNTDGLIEEAAKVEQFILEGKAK